MGMKLIKKVVIPLSSNDKQYPVSVADLIEFLNEIESGDADAEVLFTNDYITNSPYSISITYSVTKSISSADELVE